jgi:integrase
VLTHFSEQGRRARTLSHAKWLLSGIFEYGIATGVVTANPVPAAKWLTRPKETAPTVEYSLEQVLVMLRVLEPLDLRAAVAVALGFFGSMRPIEIRGLMWTDYDGSELLIQRGYHKGIVPLKTKGSNRRIKVIEPLRSLLNKLRAIRGSIHSAKRRRQAARPRFAKHARHCSRTGKGGHCMGWLLRRTARLLIADD